jgi:hypothetical protein
MRRVQGVIIAMLSPKLTNGACLESHARSRLRERGARFEKRDFLKTKTSVPGPVATLEAIEVRPLPKVFPMPERALKTPLIACFFRVPFFKTQ